VSVEKPNQPELTKQRRWELMWHPPPEVARLDTGLRYTDILFGFVIREIFLRLQYWRSLDRYAWLYLTACLALVLGSWIGYRRSLNRSAYEVKFFNLPFFRFLIDQGMLILYFQVVNSKVADLTKPWTDPTAVISLDPSKLASDTVMLLVLVFLLYLIWDYLGIRMAKSKIGNKPRYPDVRNNVSSMKQEDGFLKPDNKIINDKKPQPSDWAGFAITAICFVLFFILWRLLKKESVQWLTPIPTFVVTIILLVGYRTAKETRTSWR
jgi:hypothetical protein